MRTPVSYQRAIHQPVQRAPPRPQSSSKRGWYEFEVLSAAQPRLPSAVAGPPPRSSRVHGDAHYVRTLLSRIPPAVTFVCSMLPEPALSPPVPHSLIATRESARTNEEKG
ncbi:hypothetical protein C8Q78DRAFT_564467 [Trametes maxima]|nr:hypothetical protein C8Q78DRAFT_564467 [Trametes maxima]